MILYDLVEVFMENKIFAESSLMVKNKKTKIEK